MNPKNCVLGFHEISKNCAKVEVPGGRVFVLKAPSTAIAFSRGAFCVGMRRESCKDIIGDASEPYCIFVISFDDSPIPSNPDLFMVEDIIVMKGGDVTFTLSLIEKNVCLERLFIAVVDAASMVDELNARKD